MTDPHDLMYDRKFYPHPDSTVAHVSVLKAKEIVFDWLYDAMKNPEYKIDRKAHITKLRTLSNLLSCARANTRSEL